MKTENVANVFRKLALALRHEIHRIWNIAHDLRGGVRRWWLPLTQLLHRPAPERNLHRNRLEPLEARCLLANNVLITFDPGSHDNLISDGVLSISEAPGQDVTIGIDALASIPGNVDLTIEAADSILFANNLSSVFFPTGPDNIINLSTDFAGGGKIGTLGEFSGLFSAGAPFTIDAGGDISLAGLFGSGVDSILNAGTQQTGDLEIDLFFGEKSTISASGDINLDIVELEELEAFSETGNISDAPESAFTVAGDVKLSAPLGDVTIGELTTDSTSVSGEINVSAENVTFYNDSTTNLGVITADQDLKIVSEGNLTNSETGNISASKATLIARNGDLALKPVSADTVSLDSTGDVAISLSGNTDLGEVFVEGDLTVETSGTLGSSGSQIAVFGDTTLSAGNDIELSDPTKTKTQVFGGPVTLDGRDIVLSADSFPGFEDLALDVVDAQDLDVENNGPVSLSNVSVAGSLSIAAGGTITDDEIVEIGATLSASAELNGDFFDIALDNPGNDLGTVSVESAQDASLVDRDAIVFATTSITGDLNVQSGDTVSQVGEISVAGSTSIAALSNGDSFDITLDNIANDLGNVGAIGDDVTLADVDGLGLNTIRATSLEVNSGGSLSQLEASTISGTTRLTARKLDSVFDITFEQPGNDLSSVEFDGKTVSLVDGNSVSIAGEVSEDLIVEAGGEIRQSNAVSVAGITSLSAAGDITLDDIGNDLEVLSSLGDDITLTDLDSIQIGNTDASNLTISASGDVTQADGSTVTVPGVTNVQARKINSVFDITFEQPGNDVNSFEFDGKTVSLVDDNSVSIAGEVSDDLIVEAGGAIGQSAEVSVSGITSLSAAGDIALDDIGNDFGSIDASGQSITISDVDALALGAIDAATLNVSTGGDLTDSDDRSISIAGSTSLNADTFDITLDNPLHDFDSVDAKAHNLSISDSSAIQLADLDISGNLNVLADTISDGESEGSANDINVAGTTSLSASGDVTIDDLTNEIFELQVEGANVAASSQVSLTLPVLDATAVAQFNAPSFNVPPDSNIEANAISVFLTDNASGGSVDFLSVVDLSGGTVNITGSSAGDTFTITPSTSATFTILGDAPITNPGDELIVNLRGAGQEAVIANPGGFALPNGVIQFENPNLPITYENIERIVDNAPPRVIDVLVSGDRWNTTEEFGAFSIFGHDQCTPLPWNNLNTLEVVFDRDVEVTIDSVELFAAGDVYEFYPDDPTDTALNDGFKYDPASHTATYRVNRILGLDLFTVVVDGEVTDASPVSSAESDLLLNDGSDEIVAFDVLPGDVNGDRSVTNADIFALRRAMSSVQFGTNYDAFSDPNHDGFIGLSDMITVARLRGTMLSTCSAASESFALGGFSHSTLGEGEGESAPTPGTQDTAFNTSAASETNFRFLAAPTVPYKLTSLYCVLGRLPSVDAESESIALDQSRDKTPKVLSRQSAVTSRLQAQPPLHPTDYYFGTETEDAEREETSLIQLRPVFR